MYTKVNVAKSQKPSPGKGGGKKPLITFVDIDDLVSESPRDSKGIVIAGNHQFKPNAYAIQIYATPDTLAGKGTSEGDIDAEAIIQEFMFAHPGSEIELREFSYNWLSRNCLIFVDKCEGGDVDQYGSSCAPMRMKLEAVDDKDKNNTVFTFTSSNRGPHIAKYQGTLTLSSVADTVDADDTTVDLSAGPGEYQLTDNTSATEITTCINATDQLVFTLLGSGGANPASITDANDFILSGGTSWSGLAGSSITFRAFKSGASSWKFIELSRM